MQAVIQKLPVYLQRKWRDQASYKRTKDHRVATFEDLVNFVKTAADAANDPVYGKDAMSRSDVSKNKSPPDLNPNLTTVQA